MKEGGRTVIDTDKVHRRLPLGTVTSVNGRTVHGMVKEYTRGKTDECTQVNGLLINKMERA